LVTAVYALGVPHPTGFPLYVLTGKLWTVLVPVGSIALRMSLFSGVCSAAACAVLFILCRRLGMGIVPAVAAGLCLAFGPSFWGESNVQRVYSFNALFVAGATLCACEWWARRRSWTFALTVFVASLGSSNHTYMAIYLGCFLVFALLTAPAFVFRPRNILLASVAVIAGLLPYLFLPISARSEPMYIWGDPGTLEGFLDTVLRRDFVGRAWLEGPADLLVIAVDFIAGFGRELTWVGAALAVVGFVAGFRRGWPVLLMLSVMLGNAAIMAMHGGPRDLFLWHRYYIPSYVMAALLVGMGVDLLVARLPRWLRVLPLLIPLALAVAGWQRFDRSDYRIADDYARKLLVGLPDSSILSAADDNVLFPILYLQLVEGLRPDVRVVVHGSVPVPPSPTFDPEEQPFFFTHPPSLHHPEFEAVPSGLVFRVWRRGKVAPSQIFAHDGIAGIDDPNVPKDHDTRNLIGHYFMMRALALEQDRWTEARWNLERAAQAAPDYSPLFFNLAAIYFRNGLLDEALDAFRRSEELSPRRWPGEGMDVIAKVTAEQERVAAIEEQLRDRAGEMPSDERMYHLRMAQLLGEAGEPRAARSHQLRAADIASANAP
jgi:tetratricopeptide (TPR) repeat protein